MRSGAIVFVSTLSRDKLVAQEVFGVVVDDEVEFLFREAAMLRLSFVNPVDDGRGQLWSDVRVCGHGVGLHHMGAMGHILPRCQGSRMQHLCNKF